MYYIYFSFAIILSILMLIECHSKNLPRWYGAAVLFCPVTTPYFIIKSRKESGFILSMIFLSVFSIVCAGEIVLYSLEKEKTKYDHLTPFTKEMMILSDKIKESSAKLDAGLIKLEALSKVESRRPKLKETVDFIKYLRILMLENKKLIDELVIYAKNHQEYFIKNNLEWVFQIEQFYSNYNVVQHQKALNTYLEAFEELLKYTYINFDHIDEIKDPKHLKNYDEYYLRYRRAVDAHHLFNVKRIEYQNNFLKNYPELRPYLPGETEIEAFQLWG